MTAAGLIDPVLGSLASFVGWFAVILLGFAVLRLIAGR